MMFTWSEQDGTPHLGTKDPQCTGESGIWCMIDATTGNTWIVNENNLTEADT